jgi:hypothetical protein
VAQLFTVDLTSGAVNLLGAIGGGAFVHGIAVAPTSLRFTLGAYQGTENQDATVVVARDGISQGQVTVNYATAPGTAGSGEDFTPTSGTLTWADGDASEKAIQVPLAADQTNEGNETFTVALSAPTGGAVIGAPTAATVTIVDVPDNAAPALKLSGKRKQKLRRALKRGIAFGASTNEACALTADALISKKLAKRLKLTKRRIGRRKATLAAGKRALRVKPTKKARRKLRRQRRVTVTLRARCRDAAGNRGSAVRAVTLRR